MPKEWQGLLHAESLWIDAVADIRHFVGRPLVLQRRIAEFDDCRFLSSYESAIVEGSQR